MTTLLAVTAPFYKDIVSGLYDAAAHELHDCHLTRIDVAGAWELPLAFAHHMKTRRYEGGLVLGCVIRGETDHYRHICACVSGGINQLAVQHDWCVTLGVIMAHSYEQAAARAQDNDKNYGRQAARALRALLQSRHHHD